MAVVASPGRRLIDGRATLLKNASFGESATERENT
jgi:hypothetical protein